MKQKIFIYAIIILFSSSIFSLFAQEKNETNISQTKTIVYSFSNESSKKYDYYSYIISKSLTSKIAVQKTTDSFFQNKEIYNKTNKKNNWPNSEIGTNPDYAICGKYKIEKKTIFITAYLYDYQENKEIKLIENKYNINVQINNIINELNSYYQNYLKSKIIEIPVEKKVVKKKIRKKKKEFGPFLKIGYNIFFIHESGDEEDVNPFSVKEVYSISATLGYKLSLLKNPWLNKWGIQADYQFINYSPVPEKHMQIHNITGGLIYDNQFLSFFGGNIFIMPGICLMDSRTDSEYMKDDHAFFMKGGLGFYFIFYGANISINYSLNRIMQKDHPTTYSNINIAIGYKF